MSRNLSPSPAIGPIVAAWPAPLQPHQVEYLQGAGGFSGAEFWRLKTAAGELCLRRWPPEHPTPERLALIHAVLRHAAERGIDFLPVPLAARNGQTFVAHAGRLWELSPWLAGEGSYAREPRPAKLRAALIALAQFHAATADFPAAECRVAASPGLAQRLEQLRGWTPAELARLRDAMARQRIFEPSITHEVVSLFEQAAPQIERELWTGVRIATPLQPVIRDVWADHFLFTGDSVTGLVDFGGLNFDTPATDIARLLGSLAGDDAASWQAGLAAYQSDRPLSSEERRLVPIFDRSGVALAGMNWLRWVYLEGRSFADLQSIQQRLASIAVRLKSLR